MTSLPLSRKNKTEIKEIFSPYLKREDDIFGQEDLNDILSNNPNIEEKYFKLWITSTNVFDRIINNAIKGRSQHELERIQESSFKYVKTNNHEKALEIQFLFDDHTLLNKSSDYQIYLASLVKEDERGLKNEIYDITTSLLIELNSYAIDNLDFDISLLIDEIDTDRMFTKYFESQQPHDSEGFGKSWNSNDNDIDDLFERT